MAIGDLVIRMAADVAQLQSDMGRAVHIAERGAAKIAQVVSTIGKGLGIAFTGIGFKEIIDETIKAERSINRLNAVLQSTGFAAGLSRGEIEQLVASLERTSVFDGDEIRQGINTLLRFQDVQGDVFRDGAKLAVDLAAAMDTSLVDAFQKIGKALSDPERGLRSLRDAGVNLNESQVELAKNLFKVGDAASAQKIILDELAKTVGGASAADTAGMYGAVKRLSKAWDDFMKGLGRLDEENRRLQRTFDLISGGISLVTLGGGGKPGTAGEASDARLKAAARESERIQSAAQARIDEVREKQENEYAKREERLRKEDIDGWVKHAEEVFRLADEENLALAKIHDDYWKREEELRRIDIEGWVKHADEVFRLADEENLALAKIADDDMKRTQKAAQELGYTFQSAFEDAILSGQSLREVLKGLEKDIARVILRRTITEPLGNAISGAIARSGFSFGFGGGEVGSAAVESYQHGTDYVPRTGMALVHQGEKIIPANQNTGGAPAINFNINAVDAPSFATLLASPAGRRTIEGVVKSAYRRAGRNSGMAS